MTKFPMSIFECSHKLSVVQHHLSLGFPVSLLVDPQVHETIRITCPSTRVKLASRVYVVEQAVLDSKLYLVLSPLLSSSILTNYLIRLEQFRTLSFSHPSMIPLNDENIIYFTKDGHETHLPPPQPGQYDQTYQSLHDVAFEQRRMGVAGALEPLYNFWTDFLVDKFNLGMYQEFSNIAISEQQEGNDSGILHLVRFFGKILAGPAAISERLASDMVNLSREDKIDKRPVLQVLRAAWRNGATNMKTIKRLGDVLSAEEKAELDKSG